MQWRYLYVLFFVGLSSAATWIKYLPKKPKELAHLPGCYIEEINDVIPFGEEVTPSGQCLSIVCARRYIDYASCGVLDPGTGCYISRNSRLSYPDCCQDIICDDNNI